jgi:organic radical activating enzyme
MPRQNNESDLAYKRRVIDIKSDSFCGAKWYNATIWLGSGQTTSCHHPPAHTIDAEAIKLNPSAIHNTPKKKDDRAKMQQGLRPAGCEYCWKIEDMGRDAISDRVYKTIIHSDKDLEDAYNTPSDQDVNLRTLEIAFDRTCQFACSYCNPAFSSTWVKDIRVNGAYHGLVSDGRNHFTHTHDSSQLYKFGETNPYVEAFFKWWESDLHRTLKELRITGGEPLMSGYTWKLIEWFKQNQGKSQTKLAINSNLGFSKEKLTEFIEAIQPLPHIELYTSNEAVNQQAEYIRDGLDYKEWLNNLVTLAESGTVKAIHVMCTVNALCLDSLPEFLDQLVELKKVHGRDFPSFTLNILRFPSFQSPLVLPDELREEYKNNLAQWLAKHKGYNYLHEHEINHVVRLIDYLDVVKTPHSGEFDLPKLHNDFKQFYTQYDQRRENKNFPTTFSKKLTDWYNTL